MADYARISSGQGGSQALMGINHRQVPFCDVCGETVAKMHRIYKGSGYCGTCYKRDFVRVACITCDGSARVHKRATGPAVCGACERSARRCVRCEKPVPRAGCTVPNGVACASCAPYFRSEAPCGGCGVYSRRLSSCPDLAEGRLCDTCRNRATHATCGHCRRYRVRAGVLASGAAYCATCGTDGVSSHACPDCGADQPGLGEGRCRACLNAYKLDQEASLAAHALNRDWAHQALLEFGRWLVRRQPDDPKLVGTFRRHIRFFERIDAAFPSHQAINPNELLDLFQVSGLRTHLLPMRFLGERFGIHVSDAEKGQHVEQARINDLLRRCKGSRWAADVAAYRDDLAERGRPLRTQRLYLATTVQLLTSARVDQPAQLNAGHLRAHLLKTPGSRNNLRPFLRFLRDAGYNELSLPSESSLPEADPREVKRLRGLLGRIERLGSDAPVPLLEQAIGAAFGLDPAVLRNDGCAKVSGGQLLLCAVGEAHPVPAALASIVQRWEHARLFRTTRKKCEKKA